MSTARDKARQMKSRTLRDGDWDPHKNLIVDMHLTQKYSLHKVQVIMKERYGFEATLRQYRSRISKWDLDKNVKVNEMRFIAMKYQQREFQQPQKRPLIFKVRGKPVPKSNIVRWLRRHNPEQEPSTVASATEVTPPGISYATEPESEDDSPHSATSSQTASLHATLPPSPEKQGHGAGISETPAPIDSVQEASVMHLPLNGTGRASYILPRHQLVFNGDPAILEWVPGNETATWVTDEMYNFMYYSPRPTTLQSFDHDFWAQISTLPAWPLPTRIVTEDQKRPMIACLDSVALDPPIFCEFDRSCALSESQWADLINLVASFSILYQNCDKPSFAKFADDAIFKGNPRDEGHIFSRKMMQVYILAYWRRFSDQFPILHRPTFSPNGTPPILILVMITIGFACFVQEFGDRCASLNMGVPNYLAWSLRWSMFKNPSFRDPASRWALQALILLEIYETMYSTHDLHERAIIHHSSTVYLVGFDQYRVRVAEAANVPVSSEELGEFPQPPLNSEPGKQESWWYDWIAAETTRRLVFATFIIDALHTAVLGNGETNLMTFHEMRSSLPCDDTLWKTSSAAEVKILLTTRVQTYSLLQALKRILSGQRVSITSSFNRTIIMAGLINLAFFLKRGDLLLDSLSSVHHSLAHLSDHDRMGKWHRTMTQALDSGLLVLDTVSNGELGSLNLSPGHAVGLNTEYNCDTDGDLLHHFAHVAIHADFRACKIVAGAKTILGRNIDSQRSEETFKRMKDEWAPSARGRDAVFWAMRILHSVFLPRNDPVAKSAHMQQYSVRNDSLIHRPWILFHSMLVVWCYGYVTEGCPQMPRPGSNWRRDTAMATYLAGFGGRLAKPDDLKDAKGLNDNTALLEVLREEFATTPWEFLRESSALLGICIQLNSGAATN